jgi:hypothetical protein
MSVQLGCKRGHERQTQEAHTRLQLVVDAGQQARHGGEHRRPACHLLGVGERQRKAHYEREKAGEACLEERWW